jgi:hypothetical protein
MRKIYRNKNISVSVGDNESVNFKVKFISDANSGLTSIDVPSDNDQEIRNEGSVNIGQGRELKGEKKTAVFSSINNLAPEETDIIVEYLINDIVIHRHENKKTESDQPTIILWIKLM